MRETQTWTGTLTREETRVAVQEKIGELDEATPGPPWRSVLGALLILWILLALVFGALLLLMYDDDIDDIVAYTAIGLVPSGISLIGLLASLGSGDRGAARTRKLWRLVQVLRRPFGSAKLERLQVRELVRLRYPVSLQLDEDAATLSWSFEAPETLDRRLVKAPSSTSPPPPTSASLSLDDSRARVDLSRSPTREDIFFLEVRGPNEDARVAVEIPATAIDDDVDRDALPLLERAAICLDEDDAATLYGRLMWLTEALNIAR